MRCQEIMKSSVESIKESDSAQTAARKMREANVGFLPVCDDAQRPLGTVTDRDLALRVVAENRSMATAVRDIMTKQVVSCRPMDEVTDAARMMAQKRKSRIMVVDDDGRLTGVISLSDIAVRDGAHAAQTLGQVALREARA
jgi:CBS domain-containing protein